MGNTNIQIDYQRVSQMVNETNSVISERLGAVSFSYAKSGNGMDKSSGEMLNAVAAQIEAEKELAESMSEACRQFVSSIQNAAETFRHLDTSLTSKMELGKR